MKNKILSILDYQENITERIDKILSTLPPNEKIEYLEVLLFTIMGAQKQILNSNLKKICINKNEIKIIEKGLDIIQYHNDKYNMKIKKIERNENNESS